MGFLEDGENLGKVGSKEGFGSDLWAGRGKMGRAGCCRMAPHNVQSVATAATSSSREEGAMGMHLGVCRTRMARFPSSLVLSKGRGDICGFHTLPMGGEISLPRAGERPSQSNEKELSS